MAEDSADTLLFLTEKILCQRCKKVFPNLKQLPCLHSVCLPCSRTLQQTEGQQTIIECPLCEQQFEVEDGEVANLPQTPYVASIHKVMQIMWSKLQLMNCAFCKESPTALQGKYCSQCSKFWCKNCLTRQHSPDHDHGPLVALEDITGDSSPLRPSIVFCKEEHHESKEVEYFCTECDIAICQSCVSTEHASHINRRVLKPIAEQRKKQMEPLIDEQLVEAKKKMDEIHRIDKECDEISSQEAEAEIDVINFFNAITKCLEEKKKAILSEAKNKAEEERAHLQKQKKLLQNQEQVIRLAMEASKALRKHITSVEIIDLKKSLDKIVKEVKEEEHVHSEPERKPLQMTFVKAQEALDNLDTTGIGVLQVRSETRADLSSLAGSGISEACSGLGATFTLTTRSARGDVYYNKRDKITVAVKDNGGQDNMAELRIQDNHDGTYKITYFAKEAGESKVSVKINEEEVRGGPFDVLVKPREFKPERTFGKTFGDNVERWGLAVSDDDEIAMTVYNTCAVQLFKSDLTFLAFSKPYKNEFEKDFDAPTGIAFDKTGRLLVADSTNGVIHIFRRKSDSREYEYVGIKFGEKGMLQHQLDSPHGLSIDKNGHILVADSGNKLIKIFSAEGKFIRKIGQEGTFTYPVHCIQCDKYFVISDTLSHSIKVFDLQGAFLYQFGKKGPGMEELDSPRCLATDKLGQLLVCDTGNNRVQIFQPNESNLEIIGTIGRRGCREGEFEQPFSVGVLSDGRIVVNDIGNARMQKIA